MARRPLIGALNGAVPSTAALSSMLWAMPMSALPFVMMPILASPPPEVW